jgi:cytochrome c nitrite reductase small subunit
MRIKAVLAILPILAGTLLGAGLATFLYARGASYMTNEPAACANCHIMREQYDAWMKSSHHDVAVCNDCHTPHALVGKYLTKSENGFWHSYGFTTGRFHEPIQIKARNRAVTNQACLTCHADMVAAMRMVAGQAEPECIRCHSSVGHLH